MVNCSSLLECVVEKSSCNALIGGYWCEVKFRVGMSRSPLDRVQEIATGIVS